MYYIGIDLGTSAVKLLLMEESGKSVILYQRNIHYFPSSGLVGTESAGLVYSEHGGNEGADKGY